MLKVPSSRRARTFALFALGLIAQVVIVGVAIQGRAAGDPASPLIPGCGAAPADAFCVHAIVGRSEQQITVESTATHVTLGQIFSFFVSADGGPTGLDVSVINLSNRAEYQSVTPSEGCTLTPTRITCRFDSDVTGNTTHSFRVGVLPSGSGSVFHRVEISADGTTPLVSDVRINSQNSPIVSTPFSATATAPMAALGSYSGLLSAVFPTTRIDVFGSGSIATNPPGNATYGPLLLTPSGDVFPSPPAAPVEFDLLVSQPLSGTATHVDMAFTVMPSTVPAASHVNTFFVQVDRGAGGPLQLHVPTAIVRNTVTVVATDATATEAGLTTGTFRVTRTGSLVAPLTVSLFFVGTAFADIDYVRIPDTVTIPAGMSTADLTITPIDDNAMEGLEKLTLIVVATPAYVVGTPGSATVDIISNEVVTVVATDPTATAGLRSGTSTVTAPLAVTTGTFTVSRTGNTTAPLTVNYALGGTATRGIHYTAPLSVTIPAGALSANITITPIPDAVTGGTETVVLTLSPRSTYTVGAARSATVSITGGATSPVITVVATDSTATEAGLTTGRFTVRRAVSAPTALTVFFTVGGTATSGVDYVALPVSVTIPAGALSTFLLVAPKEDALMEGIETVVLTLSPRPNYTLGPQNSATVNIISNEVVTVTATDPTATEAGRTTGSFTVRRTGSLATPLTVFYTLGGTATRTGTGVDYAFLLGSVVIPAGRTSALVTVTPNDDPLMEGTETVVLTISPRPNYTVGSPSSATVNIISNEVVTVMATDPTATEAGNTTGRFTVRRTGLATPLTVFYALSGTAVRGSDYVITPPPPVPGRVVFPAGVLSVVLTVTPNNDTANEGPETVVFALIPQPTYTVGPPSVATVTITSNE